MFWRCRATVCSLIASSSAICRLDRPAATRQDLDLPGGEAGGELVRSADRGRDLCGVGGRAQALERGARRVQFEGRVVLPTDRAQREAVGRAAARRLVQGFRARQVAQARRRTSTASGASPRARSNVPQGRVRRGGERGRRDLGCEVDQAVGRLARGVGIRCRERDLDLGREEPARRRWLCLLRDRLTERLRGGVGLPCASRRRASPAAGRARSPFARAKAASAVRSPRRRWISPDSESAWAAIVRVEREELFDGAVASSSASSQAPRSLETSARFTRHIPGKGDSGGMESHQIWPRRSTRPPGRRRPARGRPRSRCSRSRR